MSPIWTICIPTYNRASCLKINLEYIFKEVKGELRNDIEVLVSNNCSTDNTSEIINGFLRRGCPISYYYNVENIGPDKNFLQCIEKAQGKYVLLLGDDDILLPGAISAIIEMLKKNNFGMVYIANKPIKFKEKIPATKVIVKNKITAIAYSNNNLFIRKASYFLTFMSGAVFNKELLYDLSYYDKYINSYLLQITFFLTAILRAQANLFIVDPMLATKVNDNGGYSLTDVFCINFNRILKAFMALGLTTRTISSINNDLIVHFFPFFVAKIRTEKTSFKDKNMKSIFDKYYQKNWRYYLFIYPILVLPVFLVQPYSFFSRIIGKIFGLKFGA
jgi:glycosyltransferase involved in cell wall biosynthesis